MALLDWITVTEAKLALNIQASDTSQDTEVGSYVTAVSLRLDDLAGPVVQRSVTERHHGGRAWFYPNKTPLLSVTSVTEHTRGVPLALTVETLTTLPADGYLLDQGEVHDTVVRRRKSGADASFPAGERNVVLVYVAGRYADTASVDAKFKQAAAKMLTMLWRADQGAGTVTFGAEEPVPLGGLGFSVPAAVLDLLRSELRAPTVA